MFLIDTAKHGLYLSQLHRTRTESNGLVRKTQGISHAAIGCFSQQGQCSLIEGELLLGKHMRQLR